MSESKSALEAATAIPNYTRPKLNRPAIRQRLENNVDLVPFEAKGSFTLVLTDFTVQPGNNAPFYAAAVTPIASDDPVRMPVGVSKKLWFPINRGNTPTDKNRQNRDDERLTAFILAVFRVMPGQPFDSEKGLDELIEMGKPGNDNLVFRLRHEEQPYTQEILHPLTKEIIQKVDRVGTKQHFEPVIPAAA
jgi:hypothetical protein